MKTIFRVGDTVKIVKPEFFVRCGYPLNFKQEKKNIIEKHADEIEQFVSKIVGLETPKRSQLFQAEPVKTPRHVERIAHEIAFLRIRHQGFGGDTRSIYTEFKPELQDKLFTVVSKTTCKTGTRFAPSSGYDSYTGECDYDLGGLIDPQTRIILELTPAPFELYDGNRRVLTLGDPLRIQSVNVIKVQS